MNSDTIPIVEIYRGVGIHADQSTVRIDGKVKPEIDRVLAMENLEKLSEYCRDITRPPEARLLAAAKCEAIFQIAVSERKERPNVDLDVVRACVVGLASCRCRSRTHYASIYDVPHAPGMPGPDSREQPLHD